jgi:hypothetical protein
MTTLVFTEKIARSDNNKNFVIPSLCHKCLVPSGIDFESLNNIWQFEVSLKTNSQELVKLTSAYFQHKKTINLEKYAGKLEEGDRLELHIKPKGANKDLMLKLSYHYEPSLGAIIYQNTTRKMDLGADTCTLMRDIGVQYPTLMKLATSSGASIESIELVPKYEDEEGTKTYKTDKSELDFTELDKDMMRMLKYYSLNVVTSTESSVDEEISILVYGFKSA